MRKKIKNEGLYKNPTDKDYLIEGRKPLLLVHFLENTNIESDIPKDIEAIGLGFPGGKEHRTATYIVNTTELQNYQDIEYIEEED